MPRIEEKGRSLDYSVMGEGRSSNVSVIEVSLRELPLCLKAILQNPGFSLTVLAREGERYTYFETVEAYRKGHGYYFKKIESTPIVDPGKVAISITTPEGERSHQRFFDQLKELKKQA